MSYRHFIARLMGTGPLFLRSLFGHQIESWDIFENDLAISVIREFFFWKCQELYRYNVIPFGIWNAPRDFVDVLLFSYGFWKQMFWRCLFQYSKHTLYVITQSVQSDAQYDITNMLHILVALITEGHGAIWSQDYTIIWSWTQWRCHRI